MVDVEAVAWAREMMGEPGPYVREQVSEVLASTHGQYVAMQRASGLTDASPYGLMWLAVPHALTEAFIGIAGVQVYRPRRGRYRLPLVNGVPIIPWRYAKDGKTDLKAVPFGRPVSDARKALFEPPDVPSELPLGEIGLGDAIIDDLSVEERDVLNDYATEIRALATEGLVAVLAYASNSDALLNGYFGYATLGVDGLLDWSYCEPLTFTAPSMTLRDVSSSGDRSSFDSGPLENPKLRPRSSQERASEGSSPPAANDE